MYCTDEKTLKYHYEEICYVYDDTSDSIPTGDNKNGLNLVSSSFKIDLELNLIDKVIPLFEIDTLPEIVFRAIILENTLLIKRRLLSKSFNFTFDVFKSILRHPDTIFDFLEKGFNHNFLLLHSDGIDEFSSSIFWKLENYHLRIIEASLFLTDLSFWYFSNDTYLPLNPISYFNEGIFNIVSYSSQEKIDLSILEKNLIKIISLKKYFILPDINTVIESENALTYDQLFSKSLNWDVVPSFKNSTLLDETIKLLSIYLEKLYEVSN